MIAYYFQKRLLFFNSAADIAQTPPSVLCIVLAIWGWVWWWDFRGGQLIPELWLNEFCISGLLWILCSWFAPFCYGFSLLHWSGELSHLLACLSFGVAWIAGVLYAFLVGHLLVGGCTWTCLSLKPHPLDPQHYCIGAIHVLHRWHQYFQYFRWCGSEGVACETRECN